MTDRLSPNPIILCSASGNTAGGTAFDIRDQGWGGPIGFFVTGTIGGATTKLQASADGTNWFDVTGASLAAAGHVQIAQLAAAYVRVVITGGTGNSITAYLCR